MKIPAEVAKIMSKWGGHSVRLAAARGALPMSGPNLITVLFIFYHGENAELKKEALATFKTLPAKILLSALINPDLHFSIIDLIVRIRYRDSVVMEAAMAHSAISLRSLEVLAKHGSGDVLDILSHNDQLLLKVPRLRAHIIANAHADKVMKLRLGWVEPVVEPVASPEPVPEPAPGDDIDQGAGNDPAAGSADQEEAEEGQEFGEFEQEGLSKFQELQTMAVSEKIKMALTGDKEWRTLMLREANKLVSTAVLKNPRVTEGEVMAVAKNRSASDDLIRIILLNREWLKNYEMKKALVIHPRTPLQKAMRFMTFLTEKDIRELAKSRNVSQAIANNARRMVATKKR